MRVEGGSGRLEKGREVEVGEQRKGRRYEREGLDRRTFLSITLL